MTDILVSAFLLSLVLLGIHSYFGMEIIRRGIIFTDLAIGQMAALGAATALLFTGGKYAYIISLAFAIGSAGLTTFASRREKHLEAFIGLLYAFGVAGVFILLSKSPHGMEEFNELLASDILLVPIRKIIEVAVLYLGIGLFLGFIYRKFSGMVKDFFFFAAFAFTITSSVRLAGVFVVFALLVGPAFISLKFKKGFPLVNAWLIGIVINIISIGVSYRFDLPTGYTIVLFQAFAALVVSLVKKE